jgi:hypothetical protein
MAGTNTEALPKRLDTVADFWWTPLGVAALLREAAAEIRSANAVLAEQRRRVKAAQEALSGGR